MKTLIITLLAACLAVFPSLASEAEAEAQQCATSAPPATCHQNSDIPRGDAVSSSSGFGAGWLYNDAHAETTAPAWSHFCKTDDFDGDKWCRAYSAKLFGEPYNSAWIGVECEAGSSKMGAYLAAGYINLTGGDLVDRGNGIWEDHYLRIKWDDQKPVKASFSISPSDTLHKDGVDDTDFVKSLARHNFFTIELLYYKDGNVRLKFSLAGAADAINAARKGCGMLSLADEAAKEEADKKAAAKREAEQREAKRQDAIRREAERRKAQEELRKAQEELRKAEEDRRYGPNLSLDVECRFASETTYCGVYYTDRTLSSTSVYSCQSTAIGGHTYIWSRKVPTDRLPVFENHPAVSIAAEHCRAATKEEVNEIGVTSEE